PPPTPHIHPLSLHDALPISPVRRTLRRSISLSSAVRWLTISPSMAHRSHALRPLKIEACVWLSVKETFHAHISRVPESVAPMRQDRKSTRLNSSHRTISYAV